MFLMLSPISQQKEENLPSATDHPTLLQPPWSTLVLRTYVESQDSGLESLPTRTTLPVASPAVVGFFFVVISPCHLDKCFILDIVRLPGADKGGEVE